MFFWYMTGSTPRKQAAMPPPAMPLEIVVNALPSPGAAGPARRRKKALSDEELRARREPVQRASDQYFKELVAWTDEFARVQRSLLDTGLVVPDFAVTRLQAKALRKLLLGILPMFDAHAKNLRDVGGDATLVERAIALIRDVVIDQLEETIDVCDVTLMEARGEITGKGQPLDEVIAEIERNERAAAQKRRKTSRTRAKSDRPKATGAKRAAGLK